MSEMYLKSPCSKVFVGSRWQLTFSENACDDYLQVSYKEFDKIKQAMFGTMQGQI